MSIQTTNTKPEKEVFPVTVPCIGKSGPITVEILVQIPTIEPEGQTGYVERLTELSYVVSRAVNEGLARANVEVDKEELQSWIDEQSDFYYVDPGSEDLDTNRLVRLVYAFLVGEAFKQGGG